MHSRAWLVSRQISQTPNERVLPQAELDRVIAALRLLSRPKVGTAAAVDIGVMPETYGLGLTGVAVEPTLEGGQYVSIPITRIAALRVIALLVSGVGNEDWDRTSLSPEESAEVSKSFSSLIARAVSTQEHPQLEFLPPQISQVLMNVVESLYAGPADMR